MYYVYIFSLFEEKNSLINKYINVYFPDKTTSTQGRNKKNLFYTIIKVPLRMRLLTL